MARRLILTEAEVEQEIQRLKESDFVKLSQLEHRLKQDKRRKYLADLRWHEKHGKELAQMGLTAETLRAYYEEQTEDTDND